jgi:capsular exopolysaccharide synthesis family protein
LGEITEALRRAKLEREDAAPALRSYEEPRPSAPVQARAPDRARAPVEIPVGTGPGWAARAVLADDSGSVAEHYRHFALRIAREIAERRARTVVVTSALREEGKTTTACNLALALASMSAGRPLALVELDLRRPALAASLGLRPEVGIEEVLAGRTPLAKACIPTQVGGLDVYAARRATRRAHELLAGRVLPSVLQELARGYDTVVIDTPPVLLVPDVPLAAAHIDATILVARVGVTRRRAFEEMLDHMNREKVLGVFLNQARTPHHKRQYGYYLDQDAEDEDELR